MLRLVPSCPDTPPDLPPTLHRAMLPEAARQTIQPASVLAEEYLARGAASGTATGAFEALMDWVEGRA